MDSTEKELLEEIKQAAPEDKAVKTQELLDYFNSKKSSKKKKPVGKAFSKVKSSLKGGRKSVGGLEANSFGSSTGGPIAAGTGISAISFGTLLGKKIGNAFQNAKEEKERAQQAEAAGADVPDEVKEKGYFIKKALGYEFGGKAFDTTFGAFVSSMPSKQSAGSAKFSDQFNYGENDPKNKGKEKTIPQILAKGFSDVSKAFYKVSDRLTKQNNLLKSVVDQTTANGAILESIKNSISTLTELEIKDQEESEAQQAEDTSVVSQEEVSSQEDAQQLNLLDLLDSLDDAMDIGKHLRDRKKRKAKSPRGRSTRRRSRPRSRFFGRRVKLAAGGITKTGVPAMIGEAGPELVTNRFSKASAFGVGGMKGGEYLGLAQPLATAMEMPIKVAGGSIIGTMGNFLRAAGPLGGVFAPILGGFIMPLSTIFGVNKSMVSSTIFGGVASLKESADYVVNIFKNVFRIFDLSRLFGGGGDGGGPSARPGANNNTTPGKVIQGGDADFWSLAAVASLEGVNPQGEADVAQAVYNRVASGAYSVKTIKDAILSPGQFQPVTYDGADLNKWRAIKDRQSAIAAVATHKGKGIATATKYVDEGAASITNKSLQKNAAEFIGGRTDFAVPSAANIYPGGIADRRRHGHLFGWYVGPGSISYGKKNPGPAKVPNFPVSAASGVSTANDESSSYMIKGPNSGFPIKITTNDGNTTDVIAHGKESVHIGDSGFTILPHENNKWSVSKDPFETFAQWNKVLGSSPGDTGISKGSKKMESGGSMDARRAHAARLRAQRAAEQRSRLGVQKVDGRYVNMGVSDRAVGRNPWWQVWNKKGATADRKRKQEALARALAARLNKEEGNRIKALSLPETADKPETSATTKPSASSPRRSSAAKPESKQPTLDSKLTPIQNWAKLFPDLAKKVKPGQAGYAEIQEYFIRSKMQGVSERARALAKEGVDLSISTVPVIVAKPEAPRPMTYTSAFTSSFTPPDYRKMYKDNALLRYS